jgi:hypothetical protein
MWNGRRAVIVIAGWWCGCGAGAPEASEHPRIDPGSVPSLALLGSTGPREEASASGRGQSCEDVIDEQRQRARDGTIESEEPPGEHLEEIKGVLNGGDYLNDCDVPATATVDVCAAILEGSAVGVTVLLQPGTTPQAGCVADAIRRMSFPHHDLVSVARTSFAPDQ